MKAIQIPYDENFEKKCALAAQAGFKYIAVSLHAIPDTSDAVYDAAPEHILKILRQNGLSAVQTHLYYYDLLISAETTQAEAERRTLREIEVSGKIGAPWCVWHPRTHLSDGYSEAHSFERACSAVSAYLRQAKRFGTGIAIENLLSWTGVRLYCSYPEELLALCDHFEDSNVGICWDFGHANIMGFDQAEAIKLLGQRIVCTHIHNNDGRHDFHFPPDTGNINWSKVMKAVAEIGYTGPLTLETHCLYPEDDILLLDFARYNYNCLEFLERMRKK